MLLINAVTRATVNNVQCKWNCNLHCLCKFMQLAFLICMLDA